MLVETDIKPNLVPAWTKCAYYKFSTFVRTKLSFGHPVFDEYIDRIFPGQNRAEAGGGLVWTKLNFGHTMLDGYIDRKFPGQNRGEAGGRS